ncbi:formylglycine-generating enzyme family protein [Cellvibrio sp. UBA7661]|uniref:formylglycine-generating enzyme family protein n=1 Tax=Cellvibrio sp. UBA7661 TaxID=1946311 RepID=UPI002F3599A5
MRMTHCSLLASFVGCLSTLALAQSSTPATTVIEPIMVAIPAGNLLMGDDKADTHSNHKLRVDGFQLSKYEVTEAEFNQFLLATSYKREGQCSLIQANVKLEFPFWPPQQPDPDNLNTHAAYCISWADANAYVDWLNAQTGKHYFLPSEVQWEYAARARSNSRYIHGDTPTKLCDYANVYDTPHQRQSRDLDLAQPGVACNDFSTFIAAVGSYKPNAFGLQDMTGNVSEWVADCAEDRDSANKVTACTRHILRGGSWADAEDRVEIGYRRLLEDKTPRALQAGFRLALNSREQSHRDDNFERNIQRQQAQAKTHRINSQALIKHTLAARKTWNTGELLLPPMVSIPAGEFMMGSDTDKRTQPVHRVSLKAFKMSAYEVTVKQFKQFVEHTGYVIGEDRCWKWVDEKGGSFKVGFDIAAGNWLTPAYAPSDFHPVMCVSWDDANAYLQWLSKTTGKHYRLPTDAEWEYAARAGSTSKYGVSDDEKALCDYGNIWDASGMRAFVRDKKYQAKTMACDDGSEYTSIVGRYKPNAFGLYDMLGNVSEWTQDCDRDNYVGAASDGSAWVAESCMMRSRRGSHYGPGDTQVAFRGHGGQSNRSSLGEGFRFVEVINPENVCTKDCNKPDAKNSFVIQLASAQKAQSLNKVARKN